ncbi:amino acid adenylation domain-containing protein, partial [Herbaspirillum huttiense]|uniref:amino acid adenylation domain-containing protein n=1 Tax=Herbaspirillum huttiense TaxID=863372 RepID=UPI0040596661
KVDRRALPDPAQPLQRAYEAPRGQAEQVLAAVWAEVLGLQQVGRHDNFFELGGDSILSLQIVAGLRRRGSQLAPRLIFERQTIAQLAPAIAHSTAPQLHAQASVQGELPLLPIQAEFFAMDLPERHHWNQSILLATDAPLDMAALNTALQAVVSHHDSLRLRYTRDDQGQWRQTYGQHDPAQLRELLWVRQGLPGNAIAPLCEEAQRSLNLARGPLLRALAMELEEGGWRLLLVIHHLVVDGVSWRILLADLQQAYRQCVALEPLVLPARTASYQQWAHVLQARHGALLPQLPYWQAQMQPPSVLPCDDAGGEATMRQRQEMSFGLDKERTNALLRRVPAAYRTRINDVLLTALVRALCGWSGLSEIQVDIEGHGREDGTGQLDLSRSVGWFTSVFPLRLSGAGTPQQALKRIKESLRAVPEAGLGFGLLRQAGTLPGSSSSPVIFNYLGQFDASFDGTSGWRPAQEESGAAIDPDAPMQHEFAVEGQVYDGQLLINVAYSGKRYARASVQAWVERFEQELDALITHCTSGACGATPSDFPLAGLDQTAIDQLGVSLADVADLYPLSSMQSGMLFHSVSEPDNAAYTMQMQVALEALQPERFRSAWQSVLDRHAILRSAILQRDDAPLQWVARRVVLPWQLRDCRHSPDLAAELDELARREREAGFDLARPPLMRLMLVSTGEQGYHLIWTVHHLLLDGWSTSQLLGEVLRHYAGQTLDEPVAAYGDYIRWLQGRDQQASRHHWQSLLHRLQEPSLLVARLPPAKQPNRARDYRQYTCCLGQAQTRRLVEFARARHLTLSTLVQAAWALLLQRYAGHGTVCFGATTAGRPMDLAGAESMLGLFINTLPVVTTLTPQTALDEWLQQLQRQSAQSREHEYTPLYEIQRLAGHSGQSLFDTVVVFENYPVDAALHSQEVDKLVVGEVRFSSGNHYPLTLRVSLAEQLQIDFLHDTGMIAPELLARMAAQFTSLLEQFSQDDSETRRRRLADLSLTDLPAPLQGPTIRADDVIERWAAQVSQQPGAAALTDGNHALDMAGLCAWVEQMAQQMRQRGIGCEDRVAIHAERSCAFVVAVLATLRVGAAYVPLDPALPAERLHYQLQDSAAVLLLSATAPDWAASVPVLPLASLQGVPKRVPYCWPAVHPGQAAYVIYTSGSTGRPKGVVVSRGALANYVAGVLERLDLREQDRSMAMVSTVGADLGHTVLFGALCSGRLLHLIPPQCSFDPDAMASYMEQHQVDVLKIVPSHLQALLHAASPASVLPRSRLVLGGEATRKPLLAHIASLRPQCRVMNHYGPTETTVGVLTQEASSALDEADSLPIGQPIAQARAYVLDSELQPVPQGVAGELYLAGHGVARAYQQRPAQSAERFVADLLEPGQRMYRSGDRVRQLADGSLEFLGRLDGQIKVRGYRVELREIAALLQSLEAVAQAEVVVHSEPAQPGPDGEAATPQIIAYLVPMGGQTLDLADLRQQLATRLPDYMMPTALVPLHVMPLTPNGKLDRQALPRPDSTATSVYEAARGPLEETLAGLWAELLGLPQVGRNDDFFALGGDSILVLKLVARARKRDVKLAPKMLFEGKTPAGVAQLLTAGSGAAGGVERIMPLPPAQRNGLLPASYAQARQWFLWQLDPGSSAYHINGALRLCGTLDEAALEQAFSRLLERHPSLRTVLRADADGQVLQWVQPHACLAFKRIDLEPLAEGPRQARLHAEVASLCRQPFDLEAGPLLRIGLLRESGHRHVLVMVMHHIISDGWSMQLIMDEFASLYGACCQGREAGLPALPLQYADYAVWQRQWMQGGQRETQLRYWQDHLGQSQPSLLLPADHPRRPDGLYRAARHEVVLPPPLVAALRQRVQSDGGTLFAVLLAAAQLLMYRYSGQNDIRLGVPIANRHLPDTEGVVGFFVNTQVLRAEIDPRQSLARLMQLTRETAQGAQQHQDLPFEQLVEVLQPQRLVGVNPLFQVMFNHQRHARPTSHHLPQLTLEPFELEEQDAQFELAIDTLEDTDGGLSVSLTYARELFDPQTMATMASHYLVALEALASQPQCRVGEIDWLGAAERSRLAAWGDKVSPYATPAVITTRIAQRASIQPDAVALISGNRSMSYGQLNTRVNQLAHYLLKRGLQPGARVGVALERSADMVVAVLAILKAGATYVPLDPDYPVQRLAAIIEDSALSLLLSQTSVRQRLPGGRAEQTLYLDQLDLQAQPHDEPDVTIHSDSLAYVIYTSGSTGRPKGVGISHRCLMEHGEIAADFFGLTPQDRMLQFSTLNFDGCIEQLFPPLLVGAAVVLRGPELWDSQRLHVELLAHRISVLDLTTAYWLLLVQDFARMGVRDYGVLRRVHVGGEAMPPEGIKAWRDAGLAQVELFNTYGPTEATVTASILSCAPYVSGQTVLPAQMPIGAPLAGRKLRVLDAELSPLPIGVAGELCIGGELLARGYLNRPGLSAERFVADPLGDGGARLYRTGDLVRWTHAGQLEYLGRIDHQVKIRGFRIEMGEIESIMLAQPEVREAVVVAREGVGSLQLVAYVTPQHGRHIETAELRECLVRHLPDYMVPAALVVLPALPLNANGKVDRKALPEPVYESRTGHEPPQGECEKALAAIWAEVLGLPAVGRHDNFFELGGHSLSILRIQSRIQQQFPASALPLRSHFDHPTIAAFAQQLTRSSLPSGQDEIDQMGDLLADLES